MKVPGGENAEKLRIQSLQRAKADGTDKTQANKAAENTVAEQVDSKAGSDRVSLSLGRLLSQELNPGHIDLARSQKVAELKQLIELGQYKPEPEKVAKSLADYIDEEISIEQLLSIGKDPEKSED